MPSSYIADTFNRAARDPASRDPAVVEQLIDHYYQLACQNENISSIYISLVASGRTAQGLDFQWRVSFTSEYGADCVEGADIEQVFLEAVRRREFKLIAGQKRIGKD